MLTSLIRNPPLPRDPDTPEDILNDTSLTLFYPDAQKTFHGEPGSYIIYASKKYGDIKLQLVDPEGRDDRWLFAQHLWNSGVLLAEYIARASDPPTTPDEEDFCTRWSVKGERVLELGAGTGLPSLIALLSGARSVTPTDYPSPPLLATLHANLTANLPAALAAPPHLLGPHGHEWGRAADRLTLAHAYSYSRVIACDCLWLDGEHEALVRSMRHFLDGGAGEEGGGGGRGRVWVVAGFHTGRGKVEGFLETARRKGRLGVEWIKEVDAGGDVFGGAGVREWRVGRGDDEPGGRNRWMVVAVLRVLGEGEV